MIDWRYWRWQVSRNLPLALIVAAAIAAAGWFVITSMPMTYAASSRIVLERAMGLVGRSKAQRTAEEVQHLQLVIHAMKSDADVFSADDNIELKIETSRDKPTYLYVEATAHSAPQAVAIIKALSDQSIAVSNSTQQRHANTSLEGFRAQLNATQLTLKQARAALSLHLNDAPKVTIEHLRAQAAQLRSVARNAPSDTTLVSPELQALNAQLVAARGLYSDAHPKVKLIQRRISQTVDHSPSTQISNPSKAAAEDQIAALDKLMIQHGIFSAETHRLEQDVANAATLNKVALDKLGAVQSANDASRIQMKIVEDPALTGRDPAKTRLALLIALALAALIAVATTIALRVRLDNRLRRPHDLQRSLGLTPFATLPDFGPSLG